MPVAEAPSCPWEQNLALCVCFWHQAGAELSAGTRVALEMVPGSTRARKIKKKKKKRSEEKRDFIGWKPSLRWGRACGGACLVFLGWGDVARCGD